MFRGRNLNHIFGQFADDGIRKNDADYEMMLYNGAYLRKPPKFYSFRSPKGETIYIKAFLICAPWCSEPIGVGTEVKEDSLVASGIVLADLSDLTATLRPKGDRCTDVQIDGRSYQIVTETKVR
jgi:hypothetical protein